VIINVRKDKMVYVQRIFKKEIKVQLVSHNENEICDVAERIKQYITKRFYGCDTKIVEGKLKVETDRNQTKVQIEYFKQQLKTLYHEKNITVSQSYRDVIDKDIAKIKAEINKFEKLL